MSISAGRGHAVSIATTRGPAGGPLLAQPASEVSTIISASGQQAGLALE